MSAAQVAAIGWALLAFVLFVALPAIAWPMLNSAEGAADIHRIEVGLSIGDDDGRPCTCAGRHCRECGAAGTRAQNFPELVDAQRAADRGWNQPTTAMPVIEDIVPIVGVIAGDFEPLDYGQRVTPTDLDEPVEPLPVLRTHVGVERLAPVVELVHIGRRERVAA